VDNIKEAEEQALNVAILERSGAEFLRLTDMDSLLKIFEKELVHEGVVHLLQQKNKNANSPEVKTKVQKNIADFIAHFLYVKLNIFPPKLDASKPIDLATVRYANCETRAFIMYVIWQKYFNTEIFGASASSHFFAVLPLADGTYLNLDGKPNLI